MIPRVRIQLVLAVTAAGGCILIILAARAIALQHLNASLTDPHQLGPATDHLRYQFRALFILFGIGSAVGGWIIGHYVMRPFERLRAELIAGTIVDASANRMHWSRDAFALRHAALRLESNLLHRANELMRETEDLKHLLNTVSEGLLQIDSGTRVVQTNPAAVALLGLPPGIIGQSLASLVRNAELRQIILRAAAGEDIFAAEITLADRRLLLSATPVVRAEGDAHGAAIAIADLTQVRQLEGVRRDFVANVSHELKTPLTSIHGYAETLLGDPGMPEDTRRRFVEIVHRNAIRLQRIVDDLLDLSRIESGGWEPDLQEVDVQELISEVWSSCEDVAHKREVRLINLAAPLRVQADANGLRQVFSNLFDNALRYTPAGGSISVTVKEGGDVSNRSESLVGIAVQDTGIGIPRESLGRVFERFYRVDPARSRAEGGTGLGLSIVKHMVETMNGAVTAESEPGKGTTITVWLPAA